MKAKEARTPPPSQVNIDSNANQTESKKRSVAPPSPKKHASPQETIPQSSPTKGKEPSPKKAKGNYQAYLARKTLSGPIAPGSKEIPKGSPNCLENLTFVFTGELDSLAREEAQDLVKRLGARCTTAPSGKTSFVVVGRDAGKSKLEKIEKLGIKTLDEDGLIQLIKDRSIANDIIPEINKIEISAPLADTQPKTHRMVTKKAQFNDTRLWTDKYAPRTPQDLIGNHGNYQKLVKWLQIWHPTKVRKEEKAVLISGPPGIGKTTCAHLACKEAGLDVLEMNASDCRSKKLLHDQILTIIQSQSIDKHNFIPLKENKNVKATSRPKHVLIMDEVDGMSAGDRGGMAELIQLINKKTKIPIICICNDRSSPKVRSLANYCLDLRFRRPDARQITPRIQKIASEEGLDLAPNVVDNLVTSTQADIRQIINILSNYQLTSKSLSYDKSKAIVNKDVDKGPFDATPALLSGHSFKAMSTSDRIDLYFVDSSLMPLMIQENYLYATPNDARFLSPPPHPNHKASAASHCSFDYICAAAESISEADCVERMIRGSNQEWSLAPLHSVMSCVRPAYYVHGSLGHRVEFSRWLGNNSKQSKIARLLADLSKHTWLTCHVGAADFRETYLPIISQMLLEPLLADGLEGIPKVIDLMKSLYLCKDDFDAIMEISGHQKYNQAAFAKIPAKIKSAFTRKYNSAAIKLPYALGGSGTFGVKRLSAEIDDPAAEDGGDGDVSMLAADDNGGEEEESLDPIKDKMIKQSKRSKIQAAAGGKAGK